MAGARDAQFEGRLQIHCVSQRSEYSLSPIVIGGIGRMRWQAVALGGVEDLGAVCQHKPVLAADLVAAPAAAREVDVNVRQRCEALLGEGHIVIRHALCVVLQTKRNEELSYSGK